MEASPEMAMTRFELVITPNSRKAWLSGWDSSSAEEEARRGPQIRRASFFPAGLGLGGAGRHAGGLSQSAGGTGYTDTSSGADAAGADVAFHAVKRSEGLLAREYVILTQKLPRLGSTCHDLALCTSKPSVHSSTSGSIRGNHHHQQPRSTTTSRQGTGASPAHSQSTGCLCPYAPPTTSACSARASFPGPGPLSRGTRASGFCVPHSHSSSDLLSLGARRGGGGGGGGGLAATRLVGAPLRFAVSASASLALTACAGAGAGAGADSLYASLYHNEPEVAAVLRGASSGSHYILAACTPKKDSFSSPPQDPLFTLASAPSQDSHSVSVPAPTQSPDPSFQDTQAAAWAQAQIEAEGEAEGKGEAQAEASSQTWEKRGSEDKNCARGTSEASGDVSSCLTGNRQGDACADSAHSAADSALAHRTGGASASASARWRKRGQKPWASTGDGWGYSPSSSDGEEGCTEQQDQEHGGEDGMRGGDRGGRGRGRAGWAVAKGKRGGRYRKRAMQARAGVAQENSPPLPAIPFADGPSPGVTSTQEGMRTAPRLQEVQPQHRACTSRVGISLRRTPAYQMLPGLGPAADVAAADVADGGIGDPDVAPRKGSGAGGAGAVGGALTYWGAARRHAFMLAACWAGSAYELATRDAREEEREYLEGCEEEGFDSSGPHVYRTSGPHVYGTSGPWGPAIPSSKRPSAYFAQANPSSSSLERGYSSDRGGYGSYVSPDVSGELGRARVTSPPSTHAVSLLSPHSDGSASSSTSSRVMMTSSSSSSPGSSGSSGGMQECTDSEEVSSRRTSKREAAEEPLSHSSSFPHSHPHSPSYPPLQAKTTDHQANSSAGAPSALAPVRRRSPLRRNWTLPQGERHSQALTTRTPSNGNTHSNSSSSSRHQPRQQSQKKVPSTFVGTPELAIRFFRPSLAHANGRRASRAMGPGEGYFPLPDDCKGTTEWVMEGIPQAAFQNAAAVATARSWAHSTVQAMAAPPVPSSPSSNSIVHSAIDALGAALNTAGADASTHSASTYSTSGAGVGLPGGGGRFSSGGGGYTGGVPAGVCSMEEPLPNVWGAPGRVDGRGLPVVHRQMGFVGESGPSESDCLLCVYGPEASRPALKMKGSLGHGSAQARTITLSVYLDASQVSPMQAFVFCLARADSLVAGGLIAPPQQL